MSLRKAVAVIATLDGLTRAVGVALTILTARTLQPAEIGTLGLVIAVISIISVFGGFVEAGTLVSSGFDDDGLGARTGGAIRLGLVGVLIGAVLFFQDVLVEAFLKDPERMAQGRVLLGILVLLPIIETASGIPIVFLQRRLYLAPVAARQSLQPAIYSLGGGILLLLGFGTEGLAWAQVVGAMATAISLWSLAIKRGLTLWGVSTVAARVVTRESLKQATGILGVMTERVDNILVAGSLGPAALGFYSFAWNASRLPIQILSRVSRSAFLPALVQTRDRVDESRLLLQRGLSLALGLSVGAGMLMVLFGAEVVTLVVGMKWAVAGACLETMGLTVAISPLLFLPAAALSASREAHKGALASALQICVQLLLIPPLCAAFGEQGAAVADSVAFLAVTLAVIWGTSRFGTPSVSKILAMLRAPLCGVACAAPAMILLGYTEPRGLPALVACLGASSVLYVSGYFAMTKGRPPSSA